MNHILFRADDLGYSEGVNLGIAKSVKNGLIKSVGLMSNMEYAEQGVELLKGCNIALGLHCNISAGTPLSSCASIPSLVQENGIFKKSSMYTQGFDQVVLEEAFIEIEAQVLKFMSLTGRKPSYIDGHAVASLHFFQAIEQVAKKYDIRYSPLPASEEECVCIGSTMVYMHSGSHTNESAMDTLHNIIKSMKTDECHIIVYHPGYIDAYILENSSLTTNRAYETKMLCDEKCIEYVLESHVEQITYDHL